MEGISSSDIVAIIGLFFIALPFCIKKINDIDWRERLMLLSRILIIIAFATYIGLVIYDFIINEEITNAQIVKTVGFVFSVMYAYWKLYFLKEKEMRVKEKLDYWKRRANNL